MTPPNLEALREKARSLRGCLTSLRYGPGRRRYAETEDPLGMDNSFVSDEAKILLSKVFRTTQYKTQVFTLPHNPLIRTRQSHILEVTGCAVVISDLLGLNTDLVRAAALGHDIGHVPFGHQGEDWFKKAMNMPDFCHEVFGPIIAQKIERRGQGLNLCHETLEAMMRHSGRLAIKGMTQEAWVLRYADKFSYIFHDINDIAERTHYPLGLEITTLANYFGKNQRERTTTVISALVVESAALNYVSFKESDFAKKFERLRELMLTIYPHVNQQNVGGTLGPMLDFLSMLNIGDPFLILALMTDKDIVELAPKALKDMNDFNRTPVAEIVPYLRDIGHVDMCDPGLNW